MSVTVDPRETFLGRPIPEKAAGLWYAGQIEIRPMSDWARLIETVPPEFQPRAREYLRDRWRIRKNRERLEREGKRSETGDRELAKMREVVR